MFLRTEIQTDSITDSKLMFHKSKFHVVDYRLGCTFLRQSAQLATQSWLMYITHLW